MWPFTKTQAPAPAAPKPQRTGPTREQLRKAEINRKFAVQAGANARGASVWVGTSDDYNRDYLIDRERIIARCQDVDTNNPDVHGWVRMRAAQTIGARGLRFKAVFNAEALGWTPQQASDTAAELNSLRDTWSRAGNCDLTGQARSEEKLQEIAFMTGLVQGDCLVHRVWDTDAGESLDLDLEIIPGWRIQTPIDKYGDPTISFGVQYNDTRRTKVKGYWVRLPNLSLPANSFVWDFAYQFIPLEDASLFRITEIAGLDRSLPAITSPMRALRNKNEFADSALAAARVQSKRAIAVNVEAGANAWQRAADDAQQTGTSDPVEPAPVGLAVVGDTEVWYGNPGETYANMAAAMPGPDFTGFMAYHDMRCARGLNTSISRFTRQVDNSYSGGRIEEQIDDPAVGQLRESFIICWSKVHRWFVEAAYLAGAVKLPGYTKENAYKFYQYRCQPPGKEHINPVDTANARKLGYALRTLTPQQACEEDGHDLGENLRQFAHALKLARDIEKEEGLEPGALDFILASPKEQITGTADNKPVPPAEGAAPRNGKSAPKNGTNRVGGLIRVY